MTNQPQSLQAETPLHAEVENRLGVLSNFFRLGSETPEIAANLWGFAKFGYLDNPLPALFKERLFVSLSRFCEVRYCISRHLGFLIGLGRPAGDTQASPETIEQAVRLLKRPLPRDEDLEQLVELLESCESPLRDLPDPETHLEEAIFACASHVFLQTLQAGRCLEILRRIFDATLFQHLLVFLSFVRTAHFWTKVHPELKMESDITELLAIHEGLAECLQNDPDSSNSETTLTLLEELALLRKEKERAELFRVTLSSIGDAVIAADEQGKITFLNDVAIGLTGWSSDEALGEPVESVFQIINEKTGEVVDSPVGRVLRQGVVSGVSKDTVLVSKSGARYPIDDSASPIRIGDQLAGVILVFRDITERRRQERALEEQQQQFHNLANSIPQLAWMANPDGHIFWYNQRWYEYTGTGPQDMLGWGWQSVHHPDELPAVLERWKNSLATGETFEMVFPLRGSDGIFRSFLTRVHPMRDSYGHVVRWFGTNTDISGILRNEDELREARSRLESTLKAAEIGTWEFDVVKNAVHADRNLARIFGVTSEEAAGGPIESYFRAIHPEDQDRVSLAIFSALESEDTYEADFRLLDSEGNICWVISRGRIERDDSGQAVRLPGVVIDVTSQREAEAELKRLAAESERQRRLYDTILSNSADFNYTFDLQGRFTYVNKTLLDLWRKSLSEAVGKNFHELDYPPELADRLQNQVQQVIETRHSVRAETPYRSQDGERQYEYIFVPIFGEDGSIEAVAGSTRDITEQKRVQQELREAAARLSAADRRKDEFLATLAHELRNPLAPIRTGLEVMKLMPDDRATLQEVRSMMERQAQQMVRLIDDLLDVSRITQGKLELRTCRVALREIIQSAVEATQPFIDEAGHELTVELPQQAVHLNADPNRLAQVISNLLNNSTKYTPEGGRIWLTARLEHEGIVISVRDNGMGIPLEMQDQIFEMFAQIERPVEKGYTGLGIGLTLVKRLVEMHGGSIEVFSEGADLGCEFTIRVPVLQSGSPDEPEKEAPDAQNSSLRILVVDDNLDAASMLSLVVKMLGNEVRVANDGVQAVRAAEEFLPDVVLMDIGMPQMNGYEAARLIREQSWGQQMVLVALTGWGQEEDKFQATEAGFDHHLVKPAEPAEIQRLLAGLDRSQSGGSS